MDAIFKALSDPTRRKILDLLRARDGQTVSDLEAQIALTRFGVMKHLGVLEEAGLVAAVRKGRFKHIHLNPQPLQEVMDRWMDPMVRPWTRRVADLRSSLEGEATMNAMSDIRNDFRLETWIRTTPERLWQALTDPADTANYYFGTAVRSGWKQGDSYEYSRDGAVILCGTIIEIEPGKLLVTSFEPKFPGMEGAGPTRVTFSIQAAGELCKLVIEHENIGEAGGIREGWAKIAAGLKSWLETGKPLVFPV